MNWNSCYEVLTSLLPDKVDVSRDPPRRSSDRKMLCLSFNFTTMMDALVTRRFRCLHHRYESSPSVLITCMAFV